MNAAEPVRPGEGRAIGFVLPAAALYGTFCLLPIALSLWYSLFRYGAAGRSAFAGASNYVRLFNDPVFWQAFGHNLVLLLLSLAIQIPCALFLAWLLTGRRVPGRGFFRAAFFVPMILPTAVIAVLWYAILDPYYGALNGILHQVGLLEGVVAWLDRDWVLWSLIGVISWRYVGFHMVILMAGMEGVPPELAEAAVVDGATPWGVFRHVTLPCIRPALTVSATLSVIGSLKYFDIVYIMTGGGPDHASELVATHLFAKAMEERAYGYASALAVALCLIVLAATFTVLRLADRYREEAS